MATWHLYLCERNGQLYTGITTNLARRMRQHAAKLLYPEPHPDRHEAACREREVKGWRRDKKLALIHSPR